MKKILFFLLIIFLLSPFLAYAQMTENVFEAKVMEVVDEQIVTDANGSEIFQQNLKLRGVQGEFKNQEIFFYGISNLEVVSANKYKVGDKVLINYAKDAEGEDVFFILDYVRRGNLLILAILFSLIILFVGKWKGLKALLSLIISFLIIMKFIIPNILSGHNPLAVAIIGCIFILFCIIYLTEGWRAKSHLSIISIVIALTITGGLSLLFTNIMRLTGKAEEEIMYLMGVGGLTIDFKGLLLAGIMIGALGVLDDIVVSQVEAVRQINESNPKLNQKELIKKAYKIGESHLGAIINTLFLVYAAASLPFLILFTAKSTMTFAQIINNETISIEIIRALVGSIGIALALPISTIIAACHYSKK